jgi:CRP/FNR family cyclic AMP-dependent transcriptional regulator
MKKILLIEDNEDIRQNTAEILEMANYEVYEAENGKAGIDKAMEIKPDLIICDVMMPVLDGYGMLYLLQKKPSIRHTPFIFLTAKSDKSEMRKGMEMGADDYITKPFEPAELLNAVESRLKKIDLLKTDLAAGITGLNELVQINSGKENAELFTQGRNINHYKKKQIIYYEGNRPSKLFHIQKGKIKTYKTNDEGKQLVVDVYSEGDFMGYVALLEGVNYKETAETMEESTIAVIPKEDFETLMQANTELTRKFVGLLANNVSQKEDQLLAMAYYSLRKKVANTLVMLQHKYRSSIDMSRENLAAIAGTATESFIRTLGDFKSEKLIDITKEGIIILDEAKLRRMIN